MLELTRRMTLSRNCFMRAAGVYIDENGYIDNTFNVNFKNMGKHDQQVNLDLAKTIPFSKTNEQLKCYKFPAGDLAYDSIHKLLMALSQYGLKDDLLVQTLCEQLAEGICGTIIYAGRNLEFIFIMESTIFQRKAQIRANNGNRKKFIASLCV